MDDEIEVSEYLRRLGEHWKIAFAVFCIIFGIALLYSLLVPRVYESHSTVMLLTQDPIAVSGSNPSTIKVDMNTEQQLAFTDKVASNDIGAMGRDYELTVNIVKDSYLLDFEVTAHDPDQAARVANALAKNFTDYKLRDRKQSALYQARQVAVQLEQAKANLSAINAKMASLGRNDSQYTLTKQQQTAADKIYNMLLQNLQKQQLILSSDESTAKAVERATTATLVSPNMPINLLVGVIFGVVGGLVIIFFMGSSGAGNSARKDLEERLGPVIGSIPKLLRKGHANYRILDHETHGKAVDHLNEIAARLPDTNLIAVVSGKSGDGKSILASNLALTLAHKGKRVLLVDANLRDPVITNAYQLKDKEPGLVDVITENARLDNTIRIRKTRYENLFILPAGKTTVESHQLLMTARLREICNKLRQSNFDYVIFDTASLEYSEAGNVASHCDAALYVVTPKTTKKEAVRPKANVIGVVINYK